MKNLFRPAVCLWLIFLLVCGFIISRSQFTADMSAFLPRSPSPKQQILIDQISEGFASRALLVGIEGERPAILAALSQAMSAQLQKTPHFLSVSNGQQDTAERDRELLFTNRYLLSPALNTERMSVAGLRAAIQDSLAEVSSSTGLFSKALLSRDPTGEMLEVLKTVVPQSQATQVEGVWMNNTQTRALILLQTRAQGSDLDAQEAAHTAIRESFTAAKASLGEPATKASLKFSGPSVFAVSSRDTIKSEATRLSAIGTALVLVLLWLIFRSVTTLTLGLVPVVTGAAAGVAAVGLGFPAVHGMTLGFGITLIGEAVDYAIYLFVQHEPQSDAAKGTDQPALAFTQTFWPTIRLGVLTSVVGFSALLFSGFMGLAQLGLFSIVGIVVAAFVTRYVLPILLPKNFRVRQPLSLGSRLSNIAQVLSNWKWLALGITLLSVIYIGLKGNSIWSTELGGLSPVPEAAQKLDAELRADVGAPDAGVLIVLLANERETALQLCEAVSERLTPLVTAGVLNGFEAPYNYLPSERTQLARRASLPDTATLQTRLAQALQGLPLKADKLQGFIADVTKAKDSAPLTREALEGSSLRLGVDALLMKRQASAARPSQWTALIALKPPMDDAGAAKSLDVAAIEAALNAMPAQERSTAHVLALKTEASSLYQDYLKEAIALTLMGFAAIVALLLFSLRSLARTWRVIAPLLAAVTIVAASLVLYKGSLSLLHLVGLLLVVAVGSNYALFFDQRHARSERQDKTSDHRMLCSLLFANLSTVMGFGLLGFSSVPVMNAIGMTVGIGTFLALVFSAIFART